MPRLLGVDIPGKKKIEYSLRYIYGIGPARAREIVESLKLDPNMKADDLTEEDLSDVPLTARFSAITEHMIRQRPEQWLWFHDRWRDLRLAQQAGNG